MYHSKKAEKPIQPGESSSIDVEYDTKRTGVFLKAITVNSNASNSNIILRIKGEVLPEVELDENGDPIENPKKKSKLELINCKTVLKLLKKYNSFGIDIISKNFFCATSKNELKEILEKIKDTPFILGEGTNILFKKKLRSIIKSELKE